MPAKRDLNELRARKELIIAQADLHREVIALELAQWRQRRESASAFVAGNRWWLLAGAVVAGAVLVRNWRGFASWLPTVLTAARAMMR